ncbi:MAG: lysophospholipase [Myxococcota bacterium]
MTAAEAKHERFQLESPGARLNVHRWSPVDRDTVCQLLVLHGYAEHAGRYREFALNLAPRGIAVTVPELRGHGHSDGPRGHVDVFDDYVADAETAFDTLDDASPRFILGHSNGGLVALDYVDRRPPPISGLIVTNPFLELTEKQPALKMFAGRLAARVYPKLAVPSGIPPETVSRDPEIVAAYARDPLVFTTATVGYAIAQEQTSARVQTLKHIDTALLYIYSDSDPLVSPAANARLAEQLTSPDKTVWVRAGERHEVLNELNRTQLHGAIADWIAERAA